VPNAAIGTEVGAERAFREAQQTTTARGFLL
jgi:hypothetical protein